MHDPFPLAGVVLGGVVNARRRGSLSLRARRRCRLSPHPAPRLFSSCSGVVDREERGVSYDSIIMMYHVSYRTAYVFLYQTVHGWDLWVAFYSSAQLFGHNSYSMLP